MCDQVLSLCALELHHFVHEADKDVDEYGDFRDFVNSYLRTFLFFLGDPMDADMLRVYTESVGPPTRDEILCSLMKQLVAEVKAHVVSGRAFRLPVLRKLVLQAVQRLGEIRTTHFESQWRTFESSLRSRIPDDSAAQRYYYTANLDDNSYSLYFCPKCYPHFTFPEAEVHREEALTLRSWRQVGPDGTFVVRVMVECMEPYLELRNLTIRVSTLAEGTSLYSVLSSAPHCVSESENGTLWLNMDSVAQKEKRSFLITGRITSGHPVMLDVACPTDKWTPVPQRNRRVAAAISKALVVPLNRIRVTVVSEWGALSAAPAPPITCLSITFAPSTDTTAPTPMECRQKLLQGLHSANAGLKAMCGFAYTVVPQSSSRCVAEESAPPPLLLDIAYGFLISREEEDSLPEAPAPPSRRKIFFTPDVECRGETKVPIFFQVTDGPWNVEVRSEVFRQHLGSMLSDLTVQSEVDPPTVIAAVENILEDPKYNPPASVIAVSPELLALRLALLHSPAKFQDTRNILCLIRTLNEQQFVPSSAQLWQSHWVGVEPLLSSYEQALYRSVCSLSYINHEASNFILHHHNIDTVAAGVPNGNNGAPLLMNSARGKVTNFIRRTARAEPGHVVDLSDIPPFELRNNVNGGERKGNHSSESPDRPGSSPSPARSSHSSPVTQRGIYLKCREIETRERIDRNTKELLQKQQRTSPRRREGTNNNNNKGRTRSPTIHTMSQGTPSSNGLEKGLSNGASSSPRTLSPRSSASTLKGHNGVLSTVTPRKDSKRFAFHTVMSHLHRDMCTLLEFIERNGKRFPSPEREG